MGLKKYHAVLISSKDFWIFDPDSYDSTTKLYGDFTVIKGSSKKEDSDMKQCSYFFEIGNQDNHGFKPIAIKYDEAEGFLIVEGEQQPMGKNKKRVFQIGEEARRYKNMRGPRHSVDVIVVSKDSKKTEIKDYLKQEQDGSKSAETFQADTLNQINPIFVEGAEDVMGAEDDGLMCVVCGEHFFGDECPYIGEHTQEEIDNAYNTVGSLYYAEEFEAESEIFCADCGGRRKYDAESFEAEHSCGCGDEMAFETESNGDQVKLFYEGIYTNDDEDDEREGQEIRSHSLISKKEYIDYYHDTKYNPCKCDVQGCLSCFLDEASHTPAIKNGGIRSYGMLWFEDAELNALDAESFESEGVIEAVQQNLNDKDFVNYAYKVLIGGDAKTFEEKSMAIAETMNQNANNEDFTSFVEDLLFKNAEDDEISCSCESPRIRHAGVHPRTCMACDLVVDAEDVVELVQEVSPFPMGKLFASFIVVGASAIAGAHYHKKLLNR